MHHGEARRWIVHRTAVGHWENEPICTRNNKSIHKIYVALLLGALKGMFVYIYIWTIFHLCKSVFQFVHYSTYLANLICYALIVAH